jgi:uncharacterized protein
MTPATGTISGLYRHPLKGFTPERLDEAYLTKDAFFPFDRVYALEVGASGYRREDPRFISKMKYAVLARFAAVAKLTTRYDEITETLFIDGRRFTLSQPASQHALERHIETILANFEDYNPITHPLKLLDIREGMVDRFRFTDSAKGFLSLLNLNSLRDLSKRLGQTLDPLRLRANIWVEGWQPFEDHGFVGKLIRLGGDKGPILEVLKPIVRCAATHVNPETAERDIDICTHLWEQYGHKDCGIYARVIQGGVIHIGDAVDPQAA